MNQTTLEHLAQLAVASKEDGSRKAMGAILSPHVLVQIDEN
jgi:hypothetical protein